MTRARVRARAAMLPILIGTLLPGCYRFTPVEPAAVPAGARVRAEVTQPAAERLFPLVPGTRAPRLEGRLVEVSAGGDLLLDVPQRSSQVPVGVAARPLFARVTLDPSELTRLELKQLDRSRTAFLIAGGGLGAGLLVKLAFDTVGRNTEGPGIPINELLIPLFSIRR